MLGLPLLLGYVGQLVTPEASYRSLEGPLFGTRVGIFHSDLVSHGWAELGSSVTQSPYKLILYETPIGAAEFSGELDEDLLVTVPSAVNRAVQRVLNPSREQEEDSKRPIRIASPWKPSLKTSNSRRSDWVRIQMLSLRTRMKRNMTQIPWNGSPQHSSFETSRLLMTIVETLVIRTLLG